jgi:hypothetical protein
LGPNIDQAPERFEGGGEKMKVKKETKKHIDRGEAEQEISFFIISKLQGGRVHSFILIQIF